MALRGPRKAGDHCGSDPVILLEHHGVQELPACLKPLVRLHSDACAERGRGAPPFGDRELRVEMAMHFFSKRWHRERQEASCGSDVAPNQRLPVGEQPVPGFADGLGTEHAYAGVIALGCAACSLPRRSFEKPRSQARLEPCLEMRASASASTLRTVPIGNINASATRARIDRPLNARCEPSASCVATETNVSASPFRKRWSTIRPSLRFIGLVGSAAAIS